MHTSDKFNGHPKSRGNEWLWVTKYDISAFWEHTLTRFRFSKAKPEIAKDLFETHSFPHTAPGRNNCKVNAVNCFPRNEKPVAHSFSPRRGINAAFFSSKIEARCKAKPSNGWIIVAKHDRTVFLRNKGLSCIQVQKSSLLSKYRISCHHPWKSKCKANAKTETPRTFVYSQEKREIGFFSSKVQSKAWRQAGISLTRLGDAMFLQPT